MRGENKNLRERTYRTLHVATTYIFSYTAFAFFAIFCRGKVENEEIVRRNLKNGFVIASNHVSYLDWLVLYAYFHFRHRIHLLFIAKNKLFDHPLWSMVAKGGRVVRVSDCGTRVMSIRDFRRLAEAKYIGIFPEGTRSSTGELLTPHAGAIKLAARNKIPLIPVRLEGFYETWPRGKKWPKSHPCKIIIGTECRFDQTRVAQADEAALAHCTLKILHTLEPAMIETKQPEVPFKHSILVLHKPIQATSAQWKITHDGCN